MGAVGLNKGGSVKNKRIAKAKNNSDRMRTVIMENTGTLKNAWYEEK